MTDTTLDPKLIARIKKLHNMAEGARAVGSLAEADSFMEAVNKTLAAHNLDMGVLSVDLQDLQDPMGMTGTWGVGNARYSFHRRTGRAVEWCCNLGEAVAQAHYCATNYSVKSSYLFFYGRKTNRETATRMYVYLRDLAEREGWKAFQAAQRERKRAGLGSVPRAAWLASWLEAFAAEVASRYRVMRARVEADKGMSLVLTSRRKEAYAEAKANVKVTDDESPDPRSAMYAVMEACEDGRRVAASANLRPEVLEPREAMRALP